MRSELQVASARDLVKRSWTLVESSTYPSVVVGRRGILAVHGQPGGGKSTWLVKYLDGIEGPVMLFSAEERLGPTVAGRLSRLGIKRADFRVVGQSSVDELVAEARHTKTRVLAIDSITVTTLQPTDLRRLVEAAALGALVFVLQSTKDGGAAGSHAYLHEADVVMKVEKLRWEIVKSRYQATPVAGDVVTGPT